MDKAGKEYWDSLWAAGRLPGAVDPRDQSLRNYLRRRFHGYFRSVFSRIETRDARLLEIGCARSKWLPYFAKEFGFDISGIDYSEIGCKQESDVLLKSGTKGEVVCANFFSPPEWMMGTFDVVVSFGVAEHFEDTTACIKAFSNFLKPGGIMITIIPNMSGLIGLVQRFINRPLFDIHVPLDANDLARAHQLPNLKAQDCRYFMSTNFGINFNLMGIRSGTPAWFFKTGLLWLLLGLSASLWFIEDRLWAFKANRVTSPYVICVARKSV